MNFDLQQEDTARLNTVIQWADMLLKEGRDRYRDTPTPLFADGINMVTKEHVVWGIPGQGPIT